MAGCTLGYICTESCKYRNNSIYDNIDYSHLESCSIKLPRCPNCNSKYRIENNTICNSCGNELNKNIIGDNYELYS